MTLPKNTVTTLYVCIHPEMFASGDYHARHCHKIIDKLSDDRSGALIMCPHIELPRTIDIARMAICDLSLQETDEYWLSCVALNEVEARAQHVLGERFLYGADIIDDLVRRNYDYEMRKRNALETLQQRFNVERRPLDPYDMKTLYLFERAICFGEHPGDCVPVTANALREICVHTACSS